MECNLSLSRVKLVTTFERRRTVTFDATHHDMCSHAVNVVVVAPDL